MQVLILGHGHNFQSMRYLPPTASHIPLKGAIMVDNNERVEPDVLCDVFPWSDSSIDAIIDTSGMKYIGT